MRTAARIIVPLVLPHLPPRASGGFQRMCTPRGPLFPDNLTAAVTNVAIDKHTIRCFRYDKKIGIVVDKATYDFVAEYVVPLVRGVAQNLKKSPASGGDLPQGRPQRSSTLSRARRRASRTGPYGNRWNLRGVF